MPSECHESPSGRHEFEAQGQPHPKHEARGHYQILTCRRCHKPSDAYVLVPLCCRCPGSPLFGLPKHHYWASSYLAHEQGHGHRSKLDCRNCGFSDTSSLFTQLKDCPQCSLEAQVPVELSHVKVESTEFSATITWKTQVPASSWVTINSHRYGQETPGGTTDHEVDVPSLAPGTRYTAVIESSAGSSVATVQTDFSTVELLTISSAGVALRREEDGTKSAFITWATNSPASSWVVIDGARFGQADSTVEHCVQITDLVPGLPYAAEIESVSASGMYMAFHLLTIPRIEWLGKSSYGGKAWESAELSR